MQRHVLKIRLNIKGQDIRNSINISFQSIFILFFMRRPAYGSLLLTQHAGRAASRGEGHSPTRFGRSKLYLKVGNDIIQTERSVDTLKGEGTYGREDFVE